eukprot:Tamp_17484.p1 GENE.Tamp_17484~~Tamp_17484.p1  ORF type:complete len:372 (-),score=51.58 Tamp_17484:273-1292(-)
MASMRRLLLLLASVHALHGFSHPGLHMARVGGVGTCGQLPARRGSWRGPYSPSTASRDLRRAIHPPPHTMRAEAADQPASIGEVAFSEHLALAASDVVRAIGVSRITRKWRRSRTYPLGTRGARRAKLREAYRQLNDEQRERLRYEKEVYMLQLELEYIGIKPSECPVTLSKDNSLAANTRISVFWREVQNFYRQSEAAARQAAGTIALAATHRRDAETAGPGVQDGKVKNAKGVEVELRTAGAEAAAAYMFTPRKGTQVGTRPSAAVLAGVGAQQLQRAGRRGTQVGTRPPRSALGAPASVLGDHKHRAIYLLKAQMRDLQEEVEALEAEIKAAGGVV